MSRESFLCIALVLGFGCRSSAGEDGLQREAAASTGSEESVEQPLRSPEEPPTLGDGVTRMALTCDPQSSEQCNALDDDCDGRIDEGCGYGEGQLQLTLAWNSAADIDLYLREPGGDVLSAQHRQGATGGHLDHDGRGACDDSQAHPRIEDVVYRGRPVSGEYIVEVHYLMECNVAAGSASAGPTTVTLSASVGDELLGTFNATLSPNERATLLRFVLP